MPAHTHALRTSNAVANTPNPGGNSLGLSTQVNMYFQDTPNLNMNTAIVTPVGGSLPHENRMPYLCLTFIISLYGIFPTPN